MLPDTSKVCVVAKAPNSEVFQFLANGGDDKNPIVGPPTMGFRLFFRRIRGPKIIVVSSDEKANVIKLAFEDFHASGHIVIYLFSMGAETFVRIVPPLFVGAYISKWNAYMPSAPSVEKVIYALKGKFGTRRPSGDERSRYE